jgi:hypothetical protein
MITCILIAATTEMGYSQVNMNRYASVSGTGDSLFAWKDFRKAADLYQQAFKANNGLGKVERCDTHLKLILEVALQ